MGNLKIINLRRYTITVVVLSSLLEDEHYLKVYLPLNSGCSQRLLRFSTFPEMIFDCLFISLKGTRRLLTLFVCMSGSSSRLIISCLHRWYGEGGETLKPVRNAILRVFCLMTPFIVSVFLAVWVCWLSTSFPYPRAPPSPFFPPVSRSTFQGNQLFSWSLDKYQNMAAQQTAEFLFVPLPHSPYPLITLLLAGLSIHNWTFPLLSPVGVTDNAASMFFGARWREIEHCLM